MESNARHVVHSSGCRIGGATGSGTPRAVGPSPSQDNPPMDCCQRVVTVTMPCLLLMHIHRPKPLYGAPVIQQFPGRQQRMRASATLTTLVVAVVVIAAFASRWRPARGAQPAWAHPYGPSDGTAFSVGTRGPTTQPSVLWTYSGPCYGVPPVVDGQGHLSLVNEDQTVVGG